MKSLFKLFFSVWILPLLGKFAQQVQITYVTPAAGVIRVGFNLVQSGTYVTAVGGDVVDFTKATQDPAFVGMLPAIEALGGPISLDIWDVSGNIADTYFAVLGAAQNNSKVKICSSFNGELASGAYPTTIKLIGEAVFNRL